ncbi:Alanine--tRNA ligase [Trichinella pseudospiralis]
MKKSNLSLACTKLSKWNIRKGPQVPVILGAVHPDSDYSEYFSDMGLIPEVILVDQKVLRIDVQPLCDCERYRKFWELEEIDIVYQLEIESPAEGSTIIRRDLPFFHDIGT